MRSKLEVEKKIADSAGFKTDALTFMHRPHRKIFFSTSSFDIFTAPLLKSMFATLFERSD